MRVFLLAAIMAAFSFPAWGQGRAPCGPRDDVLAHLAEQFKEAPVSVGLASNGGLLEVLTSPDGSSWTVMITMPAGVSCLIAAGEDWQPRDVTVPSDEGMPL